MNANNGNTETTTKGPQYFYERFLPANVGGIPIVIDRTFENEFIGTVCPSDEDALEVAKEMNKNIGRSIILN